MRSRPPTPSVLAPFLSIRYTQKWFLDFCEAVRSADGAIDTRMVYPADASVPTPVQCVFEGFKTWCVCFGGGTGEGRALLALCLLAMLQVLCRAWEGGGLARCSRSSDRYHAGWFRSRRQLLRISDVASYLAS